MIIHYVPCSCKEHQGNMYQRISCTELRVRKIRMKKQAIYNLLLLHNSKPFLTTDLCYEISKYF